MLISWLEYGHLGHQALKWLNEEQHITITMVNGGDDDERLSKPTNWNVINQSISKTMMVGGGCNLNDGMTRKQSSNKCNDEQEVNSRKRNQLRLHCYRML